MAHNPYRVRIVGAGDRETVAGELYFEEPGNQPGAGGPLFTVSADSLAAGGAQVSVSSQSSFELDGVALTGGGRCSVATTPAVIAAAAPVLVNPPGVSLSHVPDSADQLDVTAVWVASNMAGTEQVLLVASATVPPHAGPSGPLTIDWKTASIDGQTGADLSFDATTGLLLSTAGGIFMSAVSVTCGWD